MPDLMSVRIAILLALLGSPSYPVREHAHRVLCTLPCAVDALRQAQSCKYTEIAGRATKILSHHYRQSANRLAPTMLPVGYSRLPWVDSPRAETDSELEIQGRYLANARIKVGYGRPPDWEDYRLATQLYVHDLLLAGTDPRDVQAMLDKMAVWEREWIVQNSKRYYPPLKIPGR